MFAMIDCHWLIEFKVNTLERTEAYICYWPLSNSPIAQNKSRKRARPRVDTTLKSVGESFSAKLFFFFLQKSISPLGILRPSLFYVRFLNITISNYDLRRMLHILWAPDVPFYDVFSPPFSICGKELYSWKNQRHKLKFKEVDKYEVPPYKFTSFSLYTHYQPFLLCRKGQVA